MVDLKSDRFTQRAICCRGLIQEPSPLLMVQTVDGKYDFSWKN